MFYAIITAAVLALGILGNIGCSKIPGEGRAVRAVENMGYHDVRVVSRSPAFEVLGGCHQNDVTRFKVEGIGPDGVRRTVEVCAPVIGGYTVRN